MLLVLLSVAHAQIFNPLDPKPTPPPLGSVYTLSAGVDIDQGNTDRTVLKGGIGASWTAPRAVSLLSVTGDTSWAAGERTGQSGFAHFRHTRALRARPEGVVETAAMGPWNWVSFTQATANPFKDLVLRALVGSGIEWSVYPSERAHVVLATTLMAEYQEFEPTVVDEDAGLHARSSSYLLFAAKLDARTTAGLSGFFQPRVDQPANQRATADVFVTFDLSSGEEREGPRPKGSLRLAGGADYDSQPPPEVEKVDLSLDLLLGVTWK